MRRTLFVTALLTLTLSSGPVFAKTPVSTAPPSPWAGLKYGYLSKFCGTSDFQAVLADPAVRTGLQSLMGADAALVAPRLAMGSGMLCDDNSLTLVGQVPHQGYENMAYVKIAFYDAKPVVLLLKDNAVTVYSTDGQFDYLPNDVKLNAIDWSTGGKMLYHAPGGVRMVKGK